MPAFAIEELPTPDGLDASEADDFAAAIGVANAVEAIGYGTADLAYEPAEEVPHFLNPNEPRRQFVARVEGRIVARGLYATQVGDQADTAWILAQVLPEFQRRGIGTALADELESAARGDGKAKAVVYTPIPDTPGPRLDSPTGFGSISADNREVRFLTARGYRFEQLERVSRLALPLDGIEALVAEALAASGPDYALQYWEGPTPERWRADLAVLGTRMSTDAPSAGLEEPEDVWTVERIIEADGRNARLNPRHRITAAVEHVPSGTLVGFTVLSIPRQSHRAVDQYATLVLREHRGHKLGMLLKVGNLAHLARVRPGHPSIMTFNAEENRHMLDVNEAVGFVPVANESAWRKDLS